jgi:osmotically-inducible protein OsmY
MNKGAALIGGVGLGAALMYFFDPDRGKKRRALVRDKVEAAGNKVEMAAGKVSRDLRNRCYGMMAETKSLFRHEEAADEVLVDRVRAKLGRYPVHTGAIDITANEGTVTLSGQILGSEVQKVVRAAGLVRGVKGIDNQLEVLSEAGDIPALQGAPQPLGAQT